MVKLIGAVLFVSAAAGFGLWKANSYSERAKELQRCISSLQMLETEISYSATSLPEAFVKIGNRMPGIIGKLFEDTGLELLQGDGYSAGQIFQKQMDKWRSKLHFHPQDQEILITFGHTLGKSDRADQLKHIHLAITRLSVEETNARDERERLGKMWRYLGGLVGLATVIIMY